ncbi:radical SAM protein [Candidatus Woesearchaeota archaeon]|nr:radical SAM protein [Candidatus Woesearchaeota archaeon]
MVFTILDCYTDEPSGLGVPPYMGVYPRYIYGYLKKKAEKINYLTIDDLRLEIHYKGQLKESRKTNIKVYNLTNKNTRKILDETDILIVIAGVHVPGKYLSAVPGTLYEVTDLLKNIKCRKVLTGPGATVFGSRLEGGKFSEKADFLMFEEIIPDFIRDYDEIREASIRGAEIVRQVPYLLIAEIETARGCAKSVPCSFCTEPLKNKMEFRKIDDIINEIKSLNNFGIKYFRLGKQSDFFAWSENDIELMLRRVRNECDIKVLHIDNIDPVNVTEAKVKHVVKYCTPGNVAALGVESFDKDVVKSNNLNTLPETAIKAIRIINSYGAEIGENGMPKFLPGINILFGLINESRRTHEENMKYLQKILDENLLLRRINIRQVAIFPGTQLHIECGNKYIKKNKKYYWKWRDEIRQKIDNPMLKRLVPKGTILKDVRMEVHEGNVTFGRQIGTYPLIVGVKEKLDTGKFYNIKITDHMLRSVVGEVV